MGEVEVGEPKDGEIRVKNTAIGVNFIDVYFRKGVYTAPLPFTLGLEAVGVVTVVGSGLTGRKVGDVVVYAGKPMDSYAEEQILPANVAVPVPSSIDHKTAAAIMLKGMTVHVLIRRVFNGSHPYNGPKYDVKYNIATESALIYFYRILGKLQMSVWVKWLRPDFKINLCHEHVQDKCT